MKRRCVVAAVLLTALLACKPEEPKTQAANKGADEAYLAGPEDVARAYRGQILTGALLSGELTSNETATARAQVGGEAVEVNHDVGDQVRQGEVVVRIRAFTERRAAESATAAVATAKTELALARRDQERTSVLVDAGALAQRDLEQAQAVTANAEARLAQAQAQAAAATEQLRDAVGRAPISGQVASIPVSRGDIVGVGAELFSIVDLSNMQLEASVPSSSLSSLRVGTPVQFQVQGYGERTFTGRITRIGPAVDPNTNQLRVYATLPNPGGTLASGLYAEGRVATGAQDAVIVPSDAVAMERDAAYVMVVADGQAARRQVDLGERDDQSGTVQIASGLEAGEIVLRGSAREVKEGARVEIRGEIPAPPQPAAPQGSVRSSRRSAGGAGGETGGSQDAGRGSFDTGNRMPQGQSDRTRPTENSPLNRDSGDPISSQIGTPGRSGQTKGQGTEAGGTANGGSGSSGKAGSGK